MGWSLARAHLSTLFLSSTFYGMNMVTFFATIHRLIMVDGRLKSWKRLNIFMTVAAVLTFALSSFDMAIVLHFSVKYFIDHTPAATRKVEGLANWWGITEYSVLVILTFLGDAVLIFRVWVLWGHSLKMIAIPVAFGLVRTGCGIAVPILTKKTYDQPIHSAIQPFVTTFLVLTLVVNVISSTLIVYRIWVIHQESKQWHVSNNYEDPFYRAIRVTIEAGVIYVISLVVLLVAYLCEYPLAIPVSRITLQLVGITFNLVIIHSAQTHDQHQEVVSSLGSPSNRPPVSVNMEVTVERDPPEEPPRQNRARANSQWEKARCSWAP